MCGLGSNREERNILLAVGMLMTVLAYSISSMELRGMTAYVVPAIIWLLAAILLIKSTVIVRNIVKDKLLVILLSLLSLRFATDVIVGLNLGFGLNLLSVSTMNIVINILRTLPMIVALESLRTTLAFRVDKLRSPKTRTFLVALITIIMALAYIPVTRLLSLFPLTAGGIIPFTINRLFPLLAESAVLTTLAYVGGAILPVIYMSLVKAYIFAMPVLPVQQGHVRPLAYMLTSLLQLVLLWIMRSKRLSFKEVYSSILSKRAGALKRIFYVVMTILNIAIAGGILFLLVSGGRLTVVTSGSMTPTLNVGDVVLVVPAHELQKGTIAVYIGERSLVIHRVVGIVHDNGTKFYVFKGDANNDADPDPIPQKYIVGKMMFRVPLVGLPVILLTKNVGGFPAMSALLISLTVLLYALVLQSEVMKLW